MSAEGELRESEEWRGEGGFVRGGDAAGDEGNDGLVIFFCLTRRGGRKEGLFFVNFSREIKHWHRGFVKIEMRVGKYRNGKGFCRPGGARRFVDVLRHQRRILSLLPTSGNAKHVSI